MLARLRFRLAGATLRRLGRRLASETDPRGSALDILRRITQWMVAPDAVEFVGFEEIGARSARVSGELDAGGPAACAHPLDALTGGEIAVVPCDGAEFPPLEWHEYSDVVLFGTLRTGWLTDGAIHLKPSEFRRGVVPLGEAVPEGGWGDLEMAVKFCDVHRRPSAHLAVAHRRSDAPVIPAGVLLGGFAAENWAHWLTEFLPRLWLLSREDRALRDLPLLVPERAFAVRAIEESLESLSGGREVIKVPDWSQLRIERLVWLDGIADQTELAYAGDAPNPASFHRDATRAYSDWVIRKVGGSPGASTPSRIFLDRGLQTTRPYNRDAVLEVVTRWGFTAVTCGDLSFAEQVRLFAGADAIVGPSGADWAGLLFAREGTAALYWLPESLSGAQNWSSLAATRDVKVHELAYPTPEAGFASASYEVSIPDLSEALARLVSGEASAARV